MRQDQAWLLPSAQGGGHHGGPVATATAAGMGRHREMAPWGRVRPRWQGAALVTATWA